MKQKNILAIIVLCFLTSCAAPTPTPSPIPTAPPTSTIVLLPTSTSKPTDETLQKIPLRSLTSTAQLLPTVIPTRNVPLSEKGPWKVFNDLGTATIVATNEDGTGYTPLTKISSAYKMEYSAPAKTVAIFDLDDQNDPMLKLIRLSDKREKTIPLLSNPRLKENDLKTPTNFSPPWTNPLIALSAITSNQLPWSPNGRFLAFVAAIDGPTSDLYLYDASNESITRLSNGNNQAFDPKWSPDGRWLIHDVQTFSIGCGSLGLWVTDMSDWITRPMPKPRYTCLQIIGWINPTHLIVANHDPIGYHDAFIVDFNSFKSSTVFGGIFMPMYIGLEGNAFLFRAVPIDRKTYTPLYDTPASTASITQSGLYMVTAQNYSPKFIADSFPNDLEWDAVSKQFTASGKPCASNELLTFSATSAITCIKK